MSGRLSLTLVAVVTAFAFAIGFRAQASRDDPPPAPRTLSASGASALASDTSAQPVSRAIAAPALVTVAALPALHRAPARHRPRPVAPAPVPIAAPTAAPTVAPAAPFVVATPAPKQKSYVGRNFDSEG